jgi:hypothetical protein
LHDGAADEHGAFEGVLRLRPDQLPRRRRQQVVVGRHRLGAGIKQQEAAGAVGVLGHARRVAGLAKQRGLLVARVAGDGDGRTIEHGVTKGAG